MRTIQQTVSGIWPLQIAGKYFRIIMAAADVDVTFYRGGAAVSNAYDVGVGYYAIPEGGFDRVDITSATSQTIKIAISEGVGGYDSVAVVGSVNSLILQGGTITPEVAAVSVGASATLLAAAVSNRRRIIFYNAGTADVYLGSSAVTTANGALKIAAGDTWIETDAAGAAWYGISGGPAQSVRVQAVAL